LTPSRQLVIKSGTYLLRWVNVKSDFFELVGVCLGLFLLVFGIPPPNKRSDGAGFRLLNAFFIFEDNVILNKVAVLLEAFGL
jgi:hypothetical protein